MKSSVSPQVLALFPDYVRGVIIARNIDNHGESLKLLEWLREEELRPPETRQCKISKTIPGLLHGVRPI